MRWFWRLFGLFFATRTAPRGLWAFARYAAHSSMRRAVWTLTRPGRRRR